MWLGAVCVGLLVFVVLPCLISKRRLRIRDITPIRGSLYLAFLLAPALLPVHGQALVCPAIVLIVVGLVVPPLFFASVLFMLVTWAALYAIWCLALFVDARRTLTAGLTKTEAAEQDENKPS